MTDHLHMEAEFLELRTRHPFIIARGNQSDYRTVWVRLRDKEGHEGWGEAAPSRFYGETPETVMAALDAYAAAMPSDPFDLEETERRWELDAARQSVGPRRAVLRAARSGRQAAGRAGLPPLGARSGQARRAPPSPSASTRRTGIRLKVKEAEQYPILKIKLGTDRDRRDPAHHPRRHRQGNPGRRQLRLDP